MYEHLTKMPGRNVLKKKKNTLSIAAGKETVKLVRHNNQTENANLSIKNSALNRYFRVRLATAAAKTFEYLGREEVA